MGGYCRRRENNRTFCFTCRCLTSSGHLAEIVGDDEFNGGVALRLRLKEGVESAIAQAEERMVALPIRQKNAQE